MPNFPEDRDPVMRRLRDLERKVDGLYARNPLASATLDDEDGNRRINFGRLLSGGAFGIEVFDADGRLVFRIDEGGWRRPFIDLPFSRENDTPQVITSATWEGAWRSSAGGSTHPALFWSNYFASPVGTTGEARLVINGVPSGVYTIGSGFSGYVYWDWLLDLDLLGNSTRHITLEVRRTAGAGDIYVFTPWTIYLKDHLGATSDGLID